MKLNQNITCCSYFKKGEEGKVCVIFIHGILSDAKYFDFLYKYVPSKFTIVAPILINHGLTYKELGHSNLKDWSNQVSQIVNLYLKKGYKLILVGHSMGTLFLLEEYYKHKNDIIGLFLMNIPLYYRISYHLLKQLFLEVYPTKKSINDPYMQIVNKSLSIKLTKNIFAYIPWIKVYLQLFKKMKEVRNNYINNFLCKNVSFCSLKDEMVSFKTYKLIAEKSNLNQIKLVNSSHFYYPNGDFDIIKSNFIKFIQQLTQVE